MFKLVVLSGLLAVALAKPSAEVKSENVAQDVEKAAATIIAEKTIEAHGHSIIHHTAPSVPVAVQEGSPIHSLTPNTADELLQLPEKADKLDKPLEKLELPNKTVESPIQEKQLSDPQKSNESKQVSQSLKKTKSHRLTDHTDPTDVTGPVHIVDDLLVIPVKTTDVIDKTFELVDTPESRRSIRALPFIYQPFYLRPHLEAIGIHSHLEAIGIHSHPDIDYIIN